MNNLQVFKNKNLNLEVRTIKNEDGSISINAEDAAIGFGWIRNKNNKEYIMWDRINNFLSQLGFPHKCGKNDYIPESLFYMLAMKANNENARKFQQWLAIEVIPSIRKTGSYQNKILTATEQLELQLKIFKEHDQRMDKQDKKIDTVYQDVKHLNNDMPLFNIDCKELQAKVRKLGMKMLGGHGSQAYRDNSIRGKVYSDIQGQLKREFGVARYEAIKRCQIKRALEILTNYKLPVVLKDEIDMVNTQVKLEAM